MATAAGLLSDMGEIQLGHGQGVTSIEATTRLIAGLDQDEGSDVYVPRGDLLQLASQPYGVGEASGSSLDPAISGDVYTVTFSCDARLIPADDHEWFDDVYGHSLLDAF